MFIILALFALFKFGEEFGSHVVIGFCIDKINDFVA